MTNHSYYLAVVWCFIHELLSYKFWDRHFWEHFLLKKKLWKLCSPFTREGSWEIWGGDSNCHAWGLDLWPSVTCNELSTVSLSPLQPNKRSLLFSLSSVQRASRTFLLSWFHLGNFSDSPSPSFLPGARAPTAPLLAHFLVPSILGFSFRTRKHKGIRWPSALFHRKRPAWTFVSHYELIIVFKWNIVTTISEIIFSCLEKLILCPHPTYNFDQY